jgi:cytochrome c oxidase cbb3-type subunit 3
VQTTNPPQSDPQLEHPLDEESLRPHVYDEDIREYDNRLPNWWLWTLYGAIIFAFCYWSYYQHWNAGTSRDPGIAVMDELKENQLRASQNAVVLTDDQLWAMSRDPEITAAGRATFESTCAPCHNADLSGKIGPNLKDQIWIHGGLPHQVVNTITHGVPPKGMPTWGPILGRTRIVQVASYVLSYHHKGEPIIPAPGVVLPKD